MPVMVASSGKIKVAYGYLQFGAGTRLYVTEDKAKSPTLSVYPIVKQGNGKSVLLCKASDMFPNLVRFTWKEDSGDTEGDLLEQKDDSAVTSMLIVDEVKAKTNQYKCSVQHDSSNPQVSDVDIPKEDNKPSTTESTPVDSAICSTSPGQKEEESTNFASSELVHRLYLFNLTYVSLLVKNVLYFCAVGVLLYKRRAGNNETFSKPSPTSN
ncbi:hypothetical protein MHYP_G00006510 [Metynnis hypsauchen]